MKYISNSNVKNNINLDLKDKKILGYLSEDAKISRNILAKKVGLSKDSVKYRIERLISKGIIQGYRTIIDMSKIGFENYHIFLKLNPLTTSIESEIVKKLQKCEFIRAIIKYNGRYDYELAILVQGPLEFEKIFEKIFNECDNQIKDYEIVQLTEYYIVNTFPKNFIELDEQTFSKTSSLIKIDEKDRQILSIISNDAILPNYKIGQQINLSGDAVSYRIKKMTKEGVIQKAIPIINYSALDYGIFAILIRFNNAIDNRNLKIKDFFKTNKNILWTVRCFGKYNIIAYICVNNVKQYHETMNELKNNFSEIIMNIETLISYEEHKYSYVPKVML